MEHLVLFCLTAIVFAVLLSIVNAQPRQQADEWESYSPLLDPNFAVNGSSAQAKKARRSVAKSKEKKRVAKEEKEAE